MGTRLAMGMVTETWGLAATVSYTHLDVYKRQLNDQVLAQPPYAARGQRNTFNSEDNIYNDLLLLDVSRTADGYATTFNIGLDLSDGGVG